MDEIRPFLLVAEHHTFTAAARRAGLSQPALTAAIQRLEQQLGARLFHRGRHGAELTPAGAALLPRAQAAAAALAEGARAVRQIQGLEGGEVRIGAGSTACAHYLPGPVAEFRRRHPAVRFVLRDLAPGPALEALRTGTIDLAIVPEKFGERWVVDELVLVSAPGLDPRTAPFISVPRGTSTRTLLERHFPDADVAMELGSLESVRAYVMLGLGVALISRIMVAPELKAGVLAEHVDRRTPVRRTLRLVHRGLDRLDPAVAAFRAQLLGPGLRAPTKKDPPPPRGGRRDRPQPRR